QIETKVRPLIGHFAATTEHPQLQAVQAQAGLSFAGYFPQQADSVLAEEEQLQAISLVLGRRLRNKPREEMSVTYGAGAGQTLVRTPKWYYTMGIQFMASPEDVHRAVDSTWQVIRDLKRTGPTSEEL